MEWLIGRSGSGRVVGPGVVVTGSSGSGSGIVVGSVVSLL